MLAISCIYFGLSVIILFLISL